MEDMDNKVENSHITEINLNLIIKKLWISRIFIIKVTSIFAILSFIISIFTPNVYTASCTMVPQISKKSSVGSLGGLAAIAGIDLGNLGSGDIIPPSIYPKIMTNINFQKELIYSEFHFEGISNTLSLYDFYNNSELQKFNILKFLKKYTLGLPTLIFRKDNQKRNITPATQYNNLHIKTLSSKELNVIKIISDNISLNVNNKEGFISLNVNMPEPIVAAELALRVQELLQKYITAFKIEKVYGNLQFVNKSYDEAKNNFEKKQSELANFRDSNKNLSTAAARTNEEKLLSEYTLLYSLYTELAKQREQAKIAVSETTPTLTLIEPVVLPIEKSGPSRSKIIVLSTFLGIFLSSLFALYRELIYSLIKDIVTNK